MTSFEHAMLGVNGVLATGLNRRAGYQLVALAAVAATLPDWDGLTLLFSLEAFDAGHRVWGHSLLTCLLLGFAVGWFDYRFDLATRIGRWVNENRWITTKCTPDLLTPRAQFTLSGWLTWIAVASLASLSHLLGDLVVSGTESLPHWHVQLLWPFSDQGWVFPLVSWGDPGVTLVFVGGMFAMLKWPARTQRIAVVTLGLVAGYLAMQGMVR